MTLRGYSSSRKWCSRQRECLLLQRNNLIFRKMTARGIAPFPCNSTVFLFITTHHRGARSNQLTVMWRPLLNDFETKSNSVLFIMQNGSRSVNYSRTFESFPVQSILLCRGTLVPDMVAVSPMVKHCPFLSLIHI